MAIGKLGPEETRSYYQNNASARWTALAVICIGSFLTPLSLTSVNVAIPRIAADLQASGLHIGWLPTAFVAANAVTMLPAGRLADRWGRKRIYLLGIIWMVVASSMAAMTPNIEFLLVCRALQGVGSSMIWSCSMAIVSSVFDGRQRGFGLGISSSSVYLGMTCGPLVGGWMTEHFGWRSALAFPVPFALISIVMLVYKLKGEWRNPDAEKLDWLGTLLFGAGIVVLFVGLTALPSSRALLLLAGAFGLFWVFLIHQERTSNPLIRLKRVWQNKVFSRSALAGLLMYAAVFPMVFVISLYLQYIQLMTPSEAGKYLVIPALLMALMAPIVGRISALVPARVIGTFGCICVAGGFTIYQWLGFDAQLALVIAGLAMVGFGFGVFTTPNTTTALGAVSEERLGMASAVLSLGRVMGNITGTAVVVLLMAVLLKGQQIEPQNYPQLLAMVRYVMGISLLFALFGAYCSLKR